MAEYTEITYDDWKNIRIPPEWNEFLDAMKIRSSLLKGEIAINLMALGTINTDLKINELNYVLKEGSVKLIKERIHSVKLLYKKASEI